MKNRLVFLGMTLLLFGIFWPTFTEGINFDIIVKIRQSIYSGDGGDLFLAAITNSLTFAVPNMLIFMGLSLLHRNSKGLSLYLLFITISGFSSFFSGQPFEPITSSAAILLTLLLVFLTNHPPSSMLPRTLIAVQIIFAAQWLNIMPMFSILNFGVSDVPVSIKITGMYLDNVTILNYIGFSFLIPLTFSSVVTTLLFRMHAQNIQIVKENYQKAMTLEIMQAKIMDNRIYQEINSLAHDLKTPLVTIRGLNSLLVLSKDLTKLETYSDRIETAISKMNDMITSFLYGTSRQIIEVAVLLDYIRAQIPIEDDHMHFSFDIDPNLPKINVNKVRVARALINLIENAMLAPLGHEEKTIKIHAHLKNDCVLLSIVDNGIGIPEDKIEKIWTIGYSDKNTTGLGLAFSKQTVEENDGTIVLNSVYQQGTTVTICFPAVTKEA